MSNKTTYGLVAFKSIVQSHAQDNYDDVSAAHMAHREADDLAAKMTDHLYEIPTLDEFLTAIKAIREALHD